MASERPTGDVDHKLEAAEAAMERAIQGKGPKAPLPTAQETADLIRRVLTPRIPKS